VHKDTLLQWSHIYAPFLKGINIHGTACVAPPDFLWLTYFNTFLQHALVETEAENTRVTVINAVQHMRKFMEEMSETAHKLGMFMWPFMKIMDRSM